ncbi:lysophospholipase [Saccharomonospora piscinae]|uniref:Lysophospholipase n=1 Tax=Saccharomonospora piscinae TaxID=687388 RepID=A0A1V9A228_SACPI|nr:SGNH/GDSL hydrolase family protein [Saccharomonospora piscinae]OQO91113.1 lysophospholipase [Saccharomonospora piscinae]TLW93996.1 SGNH/GDSL hydrolase family protein [Saccharomonospora piscinae]
MGYARYVAVGDSQTEGVGDPDGDGGWRGYADRLAEHLAGVGPDVRYANLAVRGRRAHQVRAEQLAAAVALRPDLVTVVAGMNDLIRPSFAADKVVASLADMFAALTATGACVATVTFPDLALLAPVLRPLRHRVLDLNAGIRTAAARHGVVVVDTFGYAVTTDPRLWNADRIHASPLGHARIAAAFADALGLPGSDGTWSRPLPGAHTPSVARTVAAELRWMTSFAGPWLYRRVRRRPSGDILPAKRPRLTAVTPPARGPA